MSRLTLIVPCTCVWHSLVTFEAFGGISWTAVWTISRFKSPHFAIHTFASFPSASNTKSAQWRPIIVTFSFVLMLGRWPGYLSRYSDSLWAGRFGVRTPVGGARFSPPIHIYHKVHPAAREIGTLPIPREQSGRGVAIVTHPYPAPKFKNEQNCPPPLCIHVMSQGKLHLYFTLMLIQMNNCIVLRLRMSGAIPLLPVFAVMAWTEKTWPLPLLMNNPKDKSGFMYGDRS